MKRNYQTPALTVITLRMQHHILVASENLNDASKVGEGVAGAREYLGGWDDEDW